MSLAYNINFELSAAVFLVIMLLFVRIQYSTQSSVNKAFLKLTVMVLIADVLDVVTAITISYAFVVPIWANMLLNTLYLFADAMLGYQFMVYFQFYVSRSREKTPLLRLNRLLLAGYGVLLAANLFRGGIFTFSGSEGYVHGGIYPIVFLVPYYFIACSAIILISHFSTFQIWQRMSILAYLGLAILGPLLQFAVFPDVLLSLFTLALSLMMIMFTMETPDYQKLVKTIGELRVAEETAEKAKETSGTALKEAEAAKELVQEASRAKTDFLTNVSHAIRTPINEIIGYNELIIRQTQESATSEYAMNVQAAGRTLVSVVSDILDYTMMDKGELLLENAPYYVLEFLEDNVTYVKQNAKKKNLELRVSTDEKLPGKLTGDMTRLTQIVNNILSNAVKYTNEGFVELRILWEQKSDTQGIMEVTVTDSGIGMKEEDIQNISESFSRFDPGKTKDIQGLGMGLAIVTGLLKLMGSELQVQSEYGKGSSFSFRVEQTVADEKPIGKIAWNTSRRVQAQPEETICPVETSESSQEPAKALETASGEKVAPAYAEEQLPHILVVDDDVMNLRIAERMLQDKFRVDCVDSGEKALAFLRVEQPNMVLLDLHMPGMDGFEVMRRMKSEEAYRDIPIIFLTADDDRDTEVRGFREGALDFVTKPFVADIMIQRINRILELDRLQKHLQQEVDKQTYKAEERRRKVERMSLQIVSTLAGTIDAKDKYTNGHSTRVAEYAKEIARRMGKSDREQDDIYYMGLLHDIGKIGVPDDIINKNGKLTEEEYQIIKSHPAIGSDILKNISELPNIGVGARSHHERYDGRGYPDGLKGDEIPEEARIIGVADAYDAMTSKRSYRDVLPQRVVRDEIEACKGTQFDPQIADVMLQMIDADTEYHMHE